MKPSLSKSAGTMLVAESAGIGMQSLAKRPPPWLRHTKLGPGRLAAITSGRPSPFRSAMAAFLVDHAPTPHSPATVKRPLPSFR